MSYIFQTSKPQAIKHAINLGIAMQLTNISRDVLKDAYLNRIYLPENMLNEEITAKDIIKKKFNKKHLFLVIKKIIFLSEKYYDNGNSGIKYLPKKVKFPIFLASSLYRGIGKKIFSSSYNRYFLDRIVDHLLVYKGEGKIEDFPGSYTSFRTVQLEDRKNLKIANILNYFGV